MEANASDPSGGKTKLTNRTSASRRSFSLASSANAGAPF